jgi:hypothetical protein
MVLLLSEKNDSSLTSQIKAVDILAEGDDGAAPVKGAKESMED